MTVAAMYERAPREAREMMARLGIEAAGGVLPRSSLNYMTVFRQCEACRAKDACRAWLAHAPADVLLAPSFCPSGGLLFELQFDQPGRLTLSH
jgi:Family of unknown function (DUF6455)